MELNKLNLSSLFGDKMNQIDYITGLVTDDDSKMIPSSKSSTLQTETLNLSNEIENVKTPTSPENIDNTNSITGSNIGTTYNQTNNYTQSYEQQQTGNIGNDQQISREVTINETADSNNSPQISTIKADDVNTLDRKTQNTSQVIKITEEGNSDSSTSFSGNAVSNQNSKSSTTTEKELTTDKITSIKNMTTSKEDESGEQNKEITKMNTNTSGKKIKEDLSKRTQYEYDVEENTRKDEVDSSMQNMGIQDGEYDKYIKVLEKTIKSEEQHIQFTKDNDKRLAKLYGQKDSKTGEYTNAKELLDIINSDDPKKKIRYLPLTGKDGEKVTLEIWEEKYEEAKKKYKNNAIFQQKSYKSLTEEEKIKFVKELTKEEIKEAYKKEREQVYENNQGIDIEGNVGGLGLYLKENFEDLSEKDKIEFIGRYNNKKYAQLTFSVDDVKGWNEEIDEKSLEGMSNSIVDRETSVKQLKYLKKEAEMQKEIYQYEKVVYTEDYKNYTEKGTKGYEDKKKYLNSEQNKILDYIYNKQGEEKADEYIEALRGQIAKGQGIEEANEFLSELESDPEKMNKFVETMKDADKFNKCLKEGVIDGVGTFGEGVKNFFVEDYELSALEWKEQAILEVLSNNTEYSKGWCDKAYQYGNVVGNLAPSMLTTAAVTAATGGAAAPEALSFAFQTTGELAGSLAMTISAAGNSKHQALINGAGTTEAWAYGICSGLSEATMERFLGSVPGLSKLEGGYFKKMISEGIEEGSQEFVSAVLNSVILGEDINIDDVISQAKESFTMGASVSALLNIGSLKKTNIKLKYKGETVKISEKARNKIQEEISKVNEGTIDAETGNKKALEILEKELNKKGNLKETINPEEIENIEIKGRKEKTDTDNKKEKISIESEKEKSSKELSSIEEKIRIASEDIKIINKQEKQEKKESKELENQQKRQNKVTLEELTNNPQEKALDEMESEYTAPLTNFSSSNADNMSSDLKTYQISEEYKPYHKLEELLNSQYKTVLGNVLVISSTQEGLDNLIKKAGDQITDVSGSTNKPILVTDALLSSNVKNNVPDFSRQFSRDNYIGVTLDPKASRQTAIHEFGHLKSAITQFEAYKVIEDKIINVISQNSVSINNEYETKGYYILSKLKNDIVNRADIIAKKQLNYDNIDFSKLSDIEINKLNEDRTKLRLEVIEREGLRATLDIFDALYLGRVYEDISVGHGSKYYSKTSNICEELIANYSVLYAQNNTNMLNMLPRFVNDTMAEALNIINVKMNSDKTSLTLNDTIDNMLKSNRIDEAYAVASQYKDEFTLKKISKKSLGISDEKLKIGDYENAIKYAEMSEDINQYNKVFDQLYVKVGNLLESFNSKKYDEAKKLANRFLEGDPMTHNLISGYTALQNGDIKNAMMYFDTLSNDNVKNNFYKNILSRAKSQFYEAIDQRDIGTAKTISSLVRDTDLNAIVSVYENAYSISPETAIAAAALLGNKNIIKDVNRIIKYRADQAFKNCDYKLASELADTINYKKMQRKVNKELQTIGNNMKRVDAKDINQALYDQSNRSNVKQQPLYKTDGPEKDSFVALSDMHGASWVMDKVVNKYLNQYETIYNLGDIVDRGEKPFDLLLDYMELSKKYPDRVVYIPGNHDSFLYGFYRGNETIQRQSLGLIQANKLSKTYEQAEAYRIAHPQKFEEMLNWLGNQPLQRRIEKGGKKYAMAHAFFNQKIYDQNPNYSLNDYINSGANPSSESGNILWFRKGRGKYDPATLPESDVTMIVGHTPNADNLDLDGVRVIDVDGAAHKVNKDGTYSTRKYTGGDDYEVTIRLDDQTSEIARINNFNANFQNVQPMQSYRINQEYTTAEHNFNSEISKDLNQASKIVEKGSMKGLSPDNIQFFDSKNKLYDVILGSIIQKN